MTVIITGSLVRYTYHTQSVPRLIRIPYYRIDDRPIGKVVNVMNEMADVEFPKIGIIRLSKINLKVVKL